MFDDCLIELISDVKTSYNKILSLTDDKCIIDECKLFLSKISDLENEIDKTLCLMNEEDQKRLYYIIDPDTNARVDEQDYDSSEVAEDALNINYGDGKYEIEKGLQ